MTMGVCPFRVLRDEANNLSVGIRVKATDPNTNKPE
jgi:hypothetical protein